MPRTAILVTAMHPWRDVFGGRRGYTSSRAKRDSFQGKQLHMIRKSLRGGKQKKRPAQEWLQDHEEPGKNAFDGVREGKPTRNTSSSARGDTQEKTELPSGNILGVRHFKGKKDATAFGGQG